MAIYQRVMGDRRVGIRSSLGLLGVALAVASCGDFVDKAADGSPGPDGAAEVSDDAEATTLDAGPEATIDFDAAPPEPEATLAFQVIETLTVPSDATAVISTSVLTSTDTYRLRLSGTFVIGNGGQRGDAEYRDFSDTPASLKNTGNGADQGVGIDDDTIDMNKTPNWGPYQSSHIYEIDFVGKDATISANVHDSDPNNNSGTLTLEILQLLAL